MSFLTDVEAQAKQESERVIKELTQLKFDAQQVIHVLNALKLEVPKELRELSPIERVPLPMVAVPKELHPITSSSGKSVDVQVQQRETRNKGSLAAVKVRQAKAAKREQEIRKAITDQLSKGPVLRDKLMEALPYPKGTINKIGTRMKKEGFLDYRVVGFQGPTEWFLPSRPITLETLRDEVTKGEGEVNLGGLRNKFGFKKYDDLDRMLSCLMGKGVLRREDAQYIYEKPKGDSAPQSPYRGVKVKNFGGGVNGISGDKISSDKKVREVVGKIKHQGAQVKKTGSDHISVSFAGHYTIIGKTPNAGGFKQDCEKLKKMGLRV